MADFSAVDCAHMARALQLSERGQFTAHPNPMVGCVIARGAQIVGEGFHEKTGDAHAEVNALRSAAEKAQGATAYVTLEPCAHEGKTPPCVFALIGAGIARVVVAMQDPFPAVAGKGIVLLREAGIDVDVGLMASAAETVNRGFVSRVSKERPFVRLKLASSLDGAIAMASGESQWITGEQAREDVQRLRAQSGAILTGVGTVLADDPSLTVRSTAIETGGLQPRRVILDSKLRTPTDAGMLTLPGETIICHDGSAETAALKNAGATLKSFASTDDRVNPGDVLAYLAGREINNLLVEAGPTVAGQLLQHKLVDELVIYQAPHIMGSETMRLVETPDWRSLADRQELDITDVRQFGKDTRITARPAS
ncbi:MAG: bifunctional diaminohydroxyphosphoribosylaminopyrimidine deaminase/5-amino-6-(5-phosphoribosylamino)uracil reductase RibD [Pseudomonadota bacterium]